MENSFYIFGYSITKQQMINVGKYTFAVASGCTAGRLTRHPIMVSFGITIAALGADTLIQKTPLNTCKKLPIKAIRYLSSPLLIAATGRYILLLNFQKLLCVAAAACIVRNVIDYLIKRAPSDLNNIFKEQMINNNVTRNGLAPQKGEDSFVKTTDFPLGCTAKAAKVSLIALSGICGLMIHIVDDVGYVVAPNISDRLVTYMINARTKMHNFYTQNYG